MYELFVLGELCDTDMHGYLLHEILGHILGPLKTVSWGTLYPVLSRLEKAGYIARRMCPDIVGGRAKKVYKITPAGKKRWLALMATPLECSPDVEIIFRMKIAKFHLVDADLQQKTWQQYRDILMTLLSRLEKLAQRVSIEPGIASEERPDILRAISYQEQVEMARLNWVENQIGLKGATP